MGVGLLFKRKGLLDFIEVARRLPQYKFIWFGDLTHIVVPHEILDAIDHAPENCIFPGYVKGPIIEGAYSSAQCFFFPSYEETEGIVVLEALAARCPIQGVVEKKLPDLTEAGYETARERSLPAIGRQLKEIYSSVLKNY